MKRIFVAVACALAVAGTLAQSADANQVCINVRDIDHLSYPDDHTIIFHMWSGPVKVWRNELRHECPGLKFERGIAWNIWGDEVCSNMQVFYVLRRGNPCQLGNFTAVERRRDHD